MERKSKTSGPVSLYLNKVNSDTKAITCATILEACQPTHARRRWLAGFLKYIGYSMPEVLGIIQGHCHWSDYNDHVTAYQVGTIFRQRSQETQNPIARKPRKWDLSPGEILRIQRQRSINLSKVRCEESTAIVFAHPERFGHFNSWAEFLRK